MISSLYLEVKIGFRPRCRDASTSLRGNRDQHGHEVHVLLDGNKRKFKPPLPPVLVGTVVFRLRNFLYRRYLGLRVRQRHVCQRRCQAQRRRFSEFRCAFRVRIVLRRFFTYHDGGVLYIVMHCACRNRHPVSDLRLRSALPAPLALSINLRTGELLTTIGRQIMERRIVLTIILHNCTCPLHFSASHSSSHLSS